MTATNNGRPHAVMKRPRDSIWVRLRFPVVTGLAAAATVAGVLPGATAANASVTKPTGAVTSTTGNAYIVRARGDVTRAKHDVAASGGVVGTDLSIINGFTAQLSPSAVASLAHDSHIRVITPDAATTTQGSTYQPYTDAGSPVGLSNDIGYNAYWNDGHNGQGVGVALIDSGVAPVPALSASGKLIYGPDFTPTGYFSAVRGLDTFGHGTFMAGLIAGREPGLTTPYDANTGKFLGVAPDAHIVSVKVADASGATVESAVIAGIQWVVQHRNDSGLNIRVLNLSLGVRDGLSYTNDPLDAAAEAAWKAGITVVASAGNDGKVGLSAPANDPYVIAVAAIDTGSTISVSDDTVAGFSNVGNGTRNPDFGALGTHIVSTRLVHSAIDAEYGSGPGSVNSELMRGSGTSEAAAITSGAVALLLSQRPGLRPDDVKATIAAYAMPLPNLTPRNSGTGALNMGWVLNAPTVYRAQTWASAGRVRNAPASVLNVGASSTPSQAAWVGSHWTTANWHRASWVGPTWASTQWTSSDWTAADWTSSDWTHAAWTDAAWTDAAWTDAAWTDAAWTDAAWTTASWS